MRTIPSDFMILFLSLEKVSPRKMSLITFSYTSQIPSFKTKYPELAGEGARESSNKI